MNNDIISLIENGDKCFDQGDYKSALKFYQKALNLIQEPFIDQPIATEVLSALGDVYFKSGNYDEADKIFSDVMLCPNAAASPFIRLRRGQIAFELNDKKKAKIELACAYMNGGKEVFDDEDKKYLDFIEPFINPNLSDS